VKKIKKIIMISVLCIAIILIGLFSLIKFNPPMVSGTLATSGDKNSVVVEIGNKGISNVKIKDVLINNNKEPLEQKMQVSNPLKGFIISDTFDDKTKEYGITNIEDAEIQPNTSPLTQLEKVNNGTATENDKSYGLSVIYNSAIERVIIKYSYLGLTFEKTVLIID
jgi:hypothetical protein